MKKIISNTHKVYAILGITIIAFLIIFSQSCASDTYDDIKMSIPPNTEISYTTDIKPIIDARCIGCHAATNPLSGIPLATFDQNKARIDNTILRIQLADGNPQLMPAGGQPKLTDANIQKFVLWKSQGFKP